ncbi:hypothetical protein IL59_0201615 [Brucella suis bv. 4 str. 40]|nr:hypothetical protein IL59_0201615 [Brucella suis bv. 4 str. 40]
MQAAVLDLVKKYAALKFFRIDLLGRFHHGSRATREIMSVTTDFCDRTKLQTAIASASEAKE